MSESKEKYRPTIQLVHRDAATSQQLSNALMVIGNLFPYLTNPLRERENIPNQNNPPGEVLVAAENTFIRACAILDKILDDAPRWSREFQESLERNFEEAHRLNAEFLQHQAVAAKELTTPHFRFRPTLVELPSGQWAAFLGDLTQQGGALVGIGNTPALAIEAFDARFEGGVTPEMLKWLLSHEVAMDAGQPSPPFPKNEKQENANEQTSTVDKRRSRKIKKSGVGGQNLS